MKTLAFILFVIPAWSQEIWNAPPFSIAPQVLINTPNAPGTDAVVLSDNRSYSFDDQGRCNLLIHRIYRVLTAAGVRDWATTESRWEPWHETRPKLRARVIGPDGAVHELDQKTIAEAPVSESSNVYSDARILRAPLPALAVGSVVEEEISTSEATPLFAGGSVYRVFIGYGVPMQHAKLSVDAPSGAELRHVARLLPSIETNRVESAGRVRITFTQGSMPAVERAESNMPFDSPRWPEITFSTGKSWADVAAAYRRAVEQQIQPAAVEQLLPKTGKSKTEIGDSLLRILHQQVRYTGIEFGEASIVPRTPAEVLQRKYGDCKDQAALLVSMLRAAGVPSYLALLNSGTGRDVDPAFPGLGLFDHAIVYVPGEPALWADPTDEFARFNELPVSDRGRQALIVSEAGRLEMIPDARPGDNRFVETREFHLSEFGKAAVVETTKSWGSIESSYRSDYSDADPKKLKTGMDEYAKTAYLSDAGAKYEYSATADLSKHFVLRIEIAEAARGTTSATDAAVGIPFVRLTDRLPELFRAKESDKESLRKADLVLPEPYVGEWAYRLIPPVGFAPAPLPDSGSVQMGPAILTKEFKAQPDGTILVNIRFDTVKRRYTALEVEQLKKSIRELGESPMVLVRYEQLGQTLLSAGKIRESLDAFRKLTALHPKEGLHRSQISRALLAAGAGEAARREARQATELDPSARAYSNLGWVLEHDLVGRRFQKGCDLAASEAAYRKAVELDPSDLNIHVDLAILLEHSPNGTRYESKEKLAQAITEYRAMEGKLGNGYENNILYALLWARRFDELKELAGKIHNATSDALYLAAVAGKGGIAAANAEAVKRIGDNQARRNALLAAGQSLMRLRMYSEAADLMEAAAQGNEQAAALRTSIDLLRKARHYEDLMKPATDPSTALLRFFPVLFLPSVPEASVATLFSTDSPLNKPNILKSVQTLINPVRTQLAKQGIPVDVSIDLTIGSMMVKADGDDQGGYRVRAEGLAFSAQKLQGYVVREKNEYRIVSVEEATSAGAIALKWTEAGELNIARRWLDWAREQEQLAGGDDPLAGPVFPRFWTRGSDADPMKMRYAAASLIAESDDPEKAVALLEDGRKSASDADKVKFDLALVTAYRGMKQYAAMLPVAGRLHQAYPESDAALGSLIGALQNLQKWDEAENVIAARIKSRPQDHAGLALAAATAILRGDLTKAIQIGHNVVANGNATSNDLNELAWSYLLANRPVPEALDSAQKAVQASKGAEFGSLHTLAALYAEVGKTTEARQVILQAMDVGGQSEPEGNSWFVFGRIAEQFGIEDAALADYRRVEKPADESAQRAGTWAIAQRRIAELTKNK